MNYDRLSHDGICGYTQAILDIAEQLRNIENDLKFARKRLTPNIINETLSVFLLYRDKLRLNPPKGYLCYNTKLSRVVFVSLND